MGVTFWDDIGEDAEAREARQRMLEAMVVFMAHAERVAKARGRSLASHERRAEVLVKPLLELLGERLSPHLRRVR
jgi:hypothetical protein